MTNSNPETCLAERLKPFGPIEPSDRQLLSRLEDDELEVPADYWLFEANKPVDCLYVLRKGWAITEAIGVSGKRFITHIHLPGDIIGVGHVPFQAPFHRSRTITRGLVCPFPREGLTDIFEKSPRLSAMFMTVAMIDQAILQDRVQIIARNDALGKIAQFILQTLARLRLMNGHLRDQFQCPLNQTDIGDVTGLTNIHVSRTLSKLEDMRLISRHKNFIKIEDRAGLEALTDFVDRYTKLNIEWLPQRSASSE